MDPDYSVTGWVQKCSLISQEPFWKIDCNSLNVEQSSPGSPRPGPFFVRRLSLTESLSFMLFVCSSSSSVTLSSCGFLWICPFHPNFWHILIHSSLFTSDHNIPQLKFWLSNESIFISLKQNAYSPKNCSVLLIFTKNIFCSHFYYAFLVSISSFLVSLLPPLPLDCTGSPFVNLLQLNCRFDIFLKYKLIFTGRHFRNSSLAMPHLLVRCVFIFSNSKDLLWTAISHM